MLKLMNFVVHRTIEYKKQLLMKNILSLLFLAVLVLFNACEPNEDIYNEIDMNEKDESGTFMYTFTSEDYASAAEFRLEDAVDEVDSAHAEQVEDREAFSIHVDPANYIPPVLAEMYPALGKNSVGKITYNYYVGGVDYLDDFTDAIAYELVEADYDAMGDPGDYDNFSYYDPPEDYLPNFLAGKYPNAVSGDMVAVTYDYYAGTVSELTDYYQFDGTEWDVVPGTYVLTEDDYDAMGSPGNYDNFSSSDDPMDYLPTFLIEKFPYAQVGDVKVLVYDYYVGGGVTNTYAKEFHYKSSGWVEFKGIEQRTTQFSHSGTVWVKDPTITITMGTADYQMICDWVAANKDASYLPYSNTEIYFGASAYYGNFDTRSGKFADVFDSWEDAVEEGLAVAYLPSKVPDAQKTVDGIQMYYIVIFDTYSGTNATYSMKFEVTKSGPNPEFELSEGPTMR